VLFSILDFWIGSLDIFELEALRLRPALIAYCGEFPAAVAAGRALPTFRL
jgi:hypothetical protein